MATLMTDVGPKYYEGAGKLTAYTNIETWLAKDANKLVATYDSDVAGKLAAGITALKGKMDTYKA